MEFHITSTTGVGPHGRHEREATSTWACGSGASGASRRGGIALLAIVSAQIGFAVAGTAVMAVLLGVFRRLGQRSLRDDGSIAILTLGGFLTIRHIAWRIGCTIHFRYGSEPSATEPRADYRELILGRR